MLIEHPRRNLTILAVRPFIFVRDFQMSAEFSYKCSSRDQSLRIEQHNQERSYQSALSSLLALAPRTEHLLTRLGPFLETLISTPQDDYVTLHSLLPSLSRFRIIKCPRLWELILDPAVLAFLFSLVSSPDPLIASDALSTCSHLIASGYTDISDYLVGAGILPILHDYIYCQPSLTAPSITCLTHLISLCPTSRQWAIDNLSIPDLVGLFDIANFAMVESLMLLFACLTVCCRANFGEWLLPLMVEISAMKVCSIDGFDSTFRFLSVNLDHDDFITAVIQSQLANWLVWMLTRRNEGRILLRAFDLLVRLFAKWREVLSGYALLDQELAADAFDGPAGDVDMHDLLVYLSEQNPTEEERLCIIDLVFETIRVLPVVIERESVATIVQFVVNTLGDVNFEAKRSTVELCALIARVGSADAAERLLAVGAVAELVAAVGWGTDSKFRGRIVESITSLVAKFDGRGWHAAIRQALNECGLAEELVELLNGEPDVQLACLASHLLKVIEGAAPE
jgi:hypothetical protein